MNQIQIRLTATVIDPDGGQLDGWLNRKFSGDFEVYEDKDQSEVVHEEDVTESGYIDYEALEATIADLIGAIDSFDGVTAYAADAVTGSNLGLTSLIAAHVDIVSVPDYRRAVIATRTSNDLKAIPAYLPGNYRVVGSVKDFDAFGTAGLLIEGQDAAGWTLDGYVLPRLASGLHFGRELEAGELSRWIEESKYAPLQTELFEKEVN